MIRHSRLTSAALFVLAVGGSSAFAQTAPTGDAPPELPPPAPEPPPSPPPPPAVVAPATPKGTPPFKLEAANGSSIKFGLLLQSQVMGATSNDPNVDGLSTNIFLRRARVLLGGSLFGSIDYFMETDFANLFLPATVTDAMGNATYLKATPGMNIQDAFATWKAYGDMFKIDAGYMLPPLAHNAVQGAGTLLGIDYFANSFRSGAAFGSAGNPVGRDMGVQLRGLVVGGLIEYRLGLFQGLRKAPTMTEVGAKNFYRFAGRVQINFLDPEPGFFYAGTYLGAKKIASIGGSVDIQDSFKYFAGDGIVDMPAGPGVVSAQINYAHWDSGTFLSQTALGKQDALMAEAGYILTAINLSPIVRYEQRKLTTTNMGMETTIKDNAIGGGFAFWPYGHNSNLKLFLMSVDNGAANASRAIQANLQWQVYYF
ncbi:MAG TPA: hypothetical protein VHU40_10435 [Polyangia bacterium]|nr:hypothetical protein [Polyangia bacterium]